jgi:type IV pilus assembly protein PilX
MIIVKHSLKNMHANVQKGFVLFIALIALVAMSLAAAALIRSVDSSVLVAGNLAFKQSATLAAETSIEVATQALVNQAFPLNSASPAHGYFPTVTMDKASANFLDLTNDGVWAANGRQITQATVGGSAANTNGIGANNLDIGGNSIRYITQRMCRDAAATDCLFGRATSQGNSKGSDGLNDGHSPLGTTATTSPVYRITSRVDGPKNTVSYIQVYTY